MKLRTLSAAVVAAALGTACIPQPHPHHGPPLERACEAWTDPAADLPGTDSQHRPASLRVARRLADRCLHLNEVQVLGSHNSYHVKMSEPFFSALVAFDPTLAASLEYSHSPLATQFDSEATRQIELDVFADPDGGRYADRHAMALFGLPIESGIAELSEPGFKVMHVQEVDFVSTCLTFVACLEQVKAWSDAHPRHLPIMIMVEPKEDVIPDPFSLGFVQPLPITAALLDSLDAEVRSVFPAEQLITPDDVRGSHATLEEAVLADGWPTLGESKGRVMLTLLGNRDAYRTGRPSLEGRVMFTSSSPGQPDAAFVMRDSPTGANTAAIQDLVRQGYVVRTRADEPTIEARSGDTARREAALASAAQWVSTDYPLPGSSSWSDYYASIPDGHPARCNPVVTGPACRNDALEHLG